MGRPFDIRKKIIKFITRIALESNQRDKTTDEKAKRLSFFKQCFNFKSTSESDTDYAPVKIFALLTFTT